MGSPSPRGPSNLSEISIHVSHCDVCYSLELGSGYQDSDSSKEDVLKPISWEVPTNGWRTRWGTRLSSPEDFQWKDVGGRTLGTWIVTSIKLMLGMNVYISGFPAPRRIMSADCALLRIKSVILHMWGSGVSGNVPRLRRGDLEGINGCTISNAKRCS